VRTGIAEGAFIEVIGDLQPGDQVIVRGAERLRPGQKVKVVGSGASTGDAVPSPTTGTGKAT